ncbi:MAG: lycopene cyclase domain-containing protein [Dermatophilaceae bacterium]
MPEYTALAVGSVLAVVAAERFWLRTGVLRQAQYWVALAIIAVFQGVVDGWLTKLSAPIVRYDNGQTIGVRVPWDIPVEDYLFGYSMVTLTILLWVRQGTAARPTGDHGDHGDEKAARR